VTIGVIGSNSFSGINFCNYLLSQGQEVLGFSRSPLKETAFNPIGTEVKGFRFVQADLNSDQEMMFSEIRGKGVKYLVNFASQSMVAESWEHPYLTFNTNVLSKIKLYSFLIKQKFLKKYIKISTPEVFGSANITSSSYKKYNPSTPYALSHATIENYLLLLFKQFSFPVIISRFANFYGPYQKLYRVIPLAIHKANRKEKFYLQGGGTSRRSFLYSDDFCEGIYKMINTAKTGQTYQFSSKEYLTIKKIVKMIYVKKNLIPKKYIINVKDRPGKDKDYKIYDKDTRKQLKWKNKTSIDKGIDKVIEWYEKYKNNFNQKDERFKIKV